jgi:hypothetical protein
MMDDFMRDKWNRLRVAPIVWLMQAAATLATALVILRVLFRASLGLWLILLGSWWWHFLDSAAMYDTEHRIWAAFFCAAPKIAVHGVCNALTLWETARYVLPRALLIGPALFVFVGGLLLVCAAVRAASEIN